MHSFFVKKKTELCQNMQNTLAKPTMQLGGILCSICHRRMGQEGGGGQGRLQSPPKFGLLRLFGQQEKFGQIIIIIIIIINIIIIIIIIGEVQIMI